MIEIENRCVSCPKEIGCLGSNCPNRNVKVTYCDCCGDEIDGIIYEVDGEDYCEYCLKDKFRKRG